MDVEYEIRVLDIDIDTIVKKLEQLGAKRTEEMDYKRYTFYTKNRIDTEWIRLRTDGRNTTITYKNIKDNTVDGTEELEVEVEDFDKTKEMIELMGLEFKGYQENRRIRYVLNGVEIDIDSWPLIPTYLEIEGKNEKEVMQMVELLDVDKEKLTALNCAYIYKEIYGIDVSKIKSNTFEGVEYL